MQLTGEKERNTILHNFRLNVSDERNCKKTCFELTRSQMILELIELYSILYDYRKGIYNISMALPYNLYQKGP